MRNLRFRRTTLIIAFSVAIVLGVASAISGILFGVNYLAIAVIATLVVISKRELPALVCLIFLGFTIGNYRGWAVNQRLEPLTELYDQHVILTGTAQTDGVYGAKSQLAFDLADIYISDPIQTKIPGRLSVGGFGTNAVYRGDKVQIEGKLQNTLGSRQGRIGFADIKVLGRSDSFVGKTRHNFTAGMQSALPEPQASFGLGLLIGEKNTLPKKVSDNLAAVGLTHIIAVSGYNLTIIVAAVRRLLSKRSKYQTALLSSLLMGAFVLLTGFSASIVRAAIVSALSLITWYYGRKPRPMLIIAFTAAVTALWNPLYVWGDAGWYLSFLAFFGILVLAPLINKRFSGLRPRRVIGLLIIESLSAQIMTAPYILYTFKQLSLLAVPVNMLVLPLVPLAMLLSLTAGLSGMVLSAISGWFAWPARIILTYMLDLVSLFANTPHAVSKQTLSGFGLMFLYTVILLFSMVLGRAAAKRVRIIA